MQETEEKLLSDAADFEEFKNLRHPAEKTTAEPAVEKTPQATDATPASAAESGTAEPITQEKQEPAEKSAEDQIKELRKSGKHAQANKLMAEEAARPHREETERLKKELETLRSRPSEAPPKAEPKPATAAPAQPQAADPNDPEPKISDEKYAGADGFTLYNRDSAVWAFRQENRAEQQKQAAIAHGQKVQAIITAGKAAKPDFDAIVSKVVINTGVLAEGVRQLDNLADVLYKIGSDHAEITRIQALSPLDQWAELRIVSRELSRTPAVAPPLERQKPAVSRVAAPPRVLTGSDTPPPKPLSEATDFEDFKRQRKARAS